MVYVWLELFSAEEKIESRRASLCVALGADILGDRSGGPCRVEPPLEEHSDVLLKEVSHISLCLCLQKE